MILVILFPLMILLFLWGWRETGSPIFTQSRVGYQQKPFRLFKFRSMAMDTLSLPSHLVDGASITPYGRFLRKSKLDELPQLINVIKGEMSLVGPRPGLFNQFELTQQRVRYDVYSVKPGITGLSQVNGIDMSTPELLAQTDAQMIAKLNLLLYVKILFWTVMGKGSGDAIAR